MSLLTSGRRLLPVLLIQLTVVTGIVDAVSYLALGHVFVANMTGNVVFLGFAAAGAPGLSAAASLTAMASFLAGAFGGGILGRRLDAHRGRMLATAARLQFVLLTVCVVVAVAFGPEPATRWRYVLIVLLAAAMGIQNVTARRLAVADLTTTVLTLTMTGLAGDARVGGGTGARPHRRLTSLAAMFGGALVGAVLLRYAGGLTAALALAAVILGGAAVLAHVASAATPPEHWRTTA